MPRDLDQRGRRRENFGCRRAARWFALAFVSIGLETRFQDMVEMEGGRPAAAFLLAQGLNVLWTLILAYCLFGGIFFAAPNIQ